MDDRNGDRRRDVRKPGRVEIIVGVVAIPVFLCSLVAYDLVANRHISEIIVGLVVGYGLTLAGYGVDVARWLRR